MHEDLQKIRLTYFIMINSCCCYCCYSSSSYHYLLPPHRATVVKTFSRFWTNIRSDVLSEPQPTTQPPTTVFDARSFVDIANATTLCQDDQLETLPEQRPYVGILCGQDLDCPCGWICCPQCQEDNRCDGHPICRQTKYQDAVRQMQEDKLSKVAQDKDADKDDDRDKDDGDEKDGNGV